MNFIYIGGKQRPFKFGFNAVDIFCKEYEIDILEFSELFAKIVKGESTPGLLRDVVYAGLLAGALSFGETPDFTKHAVGDWMDEPECEKLPDIFKIVVQSMNLGVKKKVLSNAGSI